jgi:hypothetical protein
MPWADRTGLGFFECALQFGCAHLARNIVVADVVMEGSEAQMQRRDGCAPIVKVFLVTGTSPNRSRAGWRNR